MLGLQGGNRPWFDFNPRSLSSFENLFFCLVLACRPSIRHGLENEFKVNIEPNHTTLAGAMSSSKSTNSIFYCQNHLHNDSVPPEKKLFFVESWHLSGTTALKMTPIFLTVFITDRGACFSFPSS
jgi:hypothetical protein